MTILKDIGAKTVKTKGAFQKSELAGRTRHFDNELGFFQEVLLKNHLLCV